MAKRRRASRHVSHRRPKQELTPIMQLGVVFIIVAAMLLLMYAARTTP